jgi:type IV pilus assembly protein PilQ
MRSLRFLFVAAAMVVATGLAATGAQAPVTAGLRQYSGTPIDVDYQGANIRSVIRQLADIGGVNFVIDPTVPTDLVIDLRLVQVPWDQVMEIVLKSGQLAREIDGAVVRVLTRKAQTDEAKALVDSRIAEESAPELQTKRLRLNYAAAVDIAKLLKDAQLVSARGSVEFEERTNMLILKDLPKNLEEVQSLVAELDRPEPQVEIEARIVQANRDTARAIGVQWGLNGRMSPELGNTTSLAFPNSGALSGRVATSDTVVQGPVASDPRASALAQTGTAVNLGVPGASSAIGLAMGAVNGAFNLDVALNALERKGSLKIISTPRVTTQNNKQAEVTQGFQIPYQVVANNTITVQFKDAALKLVVTPQITAANTVIMRIVLENGAPDATRGVNGNPAIRTDRADTQVQVADGNTTVIGGIVQTTDTDSSARTPGLSKVPLLGWLFRNNSVSNVTQELLIFITPRIIRG